MTDLRVSLRTRYASGTEPDVRWRTVEDGQRLITDLGPDDLSPFIALGDLLDHASGGGDRIGSALDGYGPVVVRGRRWRAGGLTLLGEAERVVPEPEAKR